MRTEKKHTDKVLGEVTLVKSSRAKRMSIRLRADGEVVVTVPRVMPYAAAVTFLVANRQWVESARAKAAARREAAKDALAAETPSPTAEYIELLRSRAHSELPPRLAELAAANGFKYNKVFIKHNKSNWGSCSVRGNINLNLNLVRLPQELQDYVMLHELCHLRYMNHGPEFHALLESLCPNHLALRRRLRSFTLL